MLTVARPVQLSCVTGLGPGPGHSVASMGLSQPQYYTDNLTSTISSHDYYTAFITEQQSEPSCKVLQRM